MTEITDSKAWKKLVEHQKSIQATHMRDLFNQDPNRFDNFHLNFQDLIVDFSKNKINNDTLNLLIDLAREAKLDDWQTKLFKGEKINFTENRAALHTALRNQSNHPIMIDGEDVMPKINNVLDKMRKFSEDVRNRQHWHWWIGPWPCNGVQGP